MKIKYDIKKNKKVKLQKKKSILKLSQIKQNMD